MNTWQDFEHESIVVNNITSERAPECVQLLKDSIGLFADAFSIGGNLGTSNATIVKMSLLSQNLATLKCAVDIALRGYYSQSMNLLRNVYENWVAFHYLSKHPNKANCWLRSSRNKRPPSHATMLDELDEYFGEVKNNMKGWYSTLCRFAHTDAVGVLPQITKELIPGETSINFGSSYKDDLFRASAYSISFWTGVMLSDISQWVPNTNEWHIKMIAMEEKIIKFIKQENRMYGYGKN